MIELIEQTVNKIDSLIKEQLPESKYQFELYDLTTGTKHFRGLDEPFHWGSVYKLFVVAEIIKMIDEGLIKADDELILQKGRFNHGTCITKYLTHLDKLSIIDACKMVISTSDGLCADGLFEIIGFERFNNLFQKAGCNNSNLILNLDEMVKNVFSDFDVSRKTEFYLSEDYFNYFDEKLDNLLTENYTNVKDLNQTFHFVLTKYLSEKGQALFLDCLSIQNLLSKLGGFDMFLSPVSLKGKTGSLGFGQISNETVVFHEKKFQLITGYFSINTKANKKRYSESSSTLGLIGLEIAKLYEEISRNS